MVGGDIKFHLPQHDLWGLRSIIRPQAGFYCFLTGLCCSMLLSRLLLHYDYEATAAFEEAKEAAEEEEAEEMEEGFGVGPSAFVGASDGDGDCDGGELKEEAEERDGSGGDEQGSAATPAASAAKGIEVSAQSPRSSSCLARAKRLIDTLGVPSGSVAQDIATPYLLFALLAVLIVGLATPCFSFHYEGLFGWVLAHVTTNWPDVSPPVQISTVVSLGLSVPTATDTPDAFGVRYLQAAFLFFVVVAPVGCLLLLLAISLAPVRGGGELLTAAEVRVCL